MHRAIKRITMMAAALAVLALIFMPGVARAQAPAGGFDVSACQENLVQGLSKRAQDRSVMAHKVFESGPIPSMRIAYCWNTLSNLILSIGTITDPFGLVWAAVAAILNNILNQVCQAVLGAVTSAISSVNNLVRNLLCLPLPHFNLGINFSLGNFRQGSCSGVSLMPSALALTGSRRQTPPWWVLWNTYQ
ncbi:MAG: hypothetical protein AB7H77_08125 [Bdellovibrionales bacterium]